MEYARITGTDSELAALSPREGVIVTGGRLADDGSREVLAYLDDGVRDALIAEGLTVTVIADTDVTGSHLSTALGQVGQGPVAAEITLKGEFSAELLQAAMVFARDRLNALAADALGSAAALAAKLGVAPGPDITAELAGAVGGIDVFSGAVEAALRHPSLGSVQVALAPLAAGVASLEQAVAALGGDLATLLRGVLSVPIPGGGVLAQLRLPAGPGAVTSSGGVLAYTVTADHPNIVGISADSVAVSAGLRFRDGAPSFGLTVRVTGARIALPGAGALLGALGIGNGAIAADVAVTVDPVAGLTIGGASGGRIALPARKQAGPLNVKGLELDFSRDGAQLIFDLIALVEGNLGPPLRLTVDGAGLRLAVDPSQQAPLRPPTVKLPTGFGVALNAGPVRGGGYLSVRPVPEHPDWKRYGGALSLRLGPVEVNAFGLITDRPDGFAFVVVMSAQLNPPIELALLFTLNGVGGILGVEVAADTEALRAQLKTGALGNLLFPADPIAAAPGILDTLAAVFPVTHGGFVVGPMLKLGWGRPISFVTAELALVLSLPDVKVLLLGRVRLAIPAPEVPLIDLRADIYGEFSDDRVLLLASLVDSRVGFFSVAGDFGLLLRFGDDPTFALSAGGFHPRYLPPTELATLRRVSAELSPPVGFQLRVTAYAAVTTNSVQFGGQLEMAYAIGPAGVYGHLGLDAIIRWAPRFGFEADISAGVAVRAFDVSVASVELRLHLEGPGPWKAWGIGTVSLPWPAPDVSIDVGPITWGQDTQPPAQLVSPRHLVAEALSQGAAWRAGAPGRQPGVRLRDEPAPPTDTILVEPWSLLEGAQAAVPLDTDIVRVGASRVVAGENRIGLGDPDFTHTGGVVSNTAVHSPVTDRFAPGQYLDLPDDQQLARPSFESFPAGMRIDPAGIAEITSPASEAELRYETSFPHRTTGRIRQLVALHAATRLLLGATAAGASTLRAADRYQIAAPPLPIAPAEAAVVRSRADMAPVAGVPAAAMTFTHAAQAAAAATAAGQPADTLQVVALGAA
jgi:hypothetical protein